MKVLAVAGNARPRGNTEYLIEAFCRGIESTGAEVEVVYLRKLAITPCDGCEGCETRHTCRKLHDDMEPLYPVIGAADAIVLASPVYNYNVTAQMKAFIDRLYPFYDFASTHPRAYTSMFEGLGRHAAVLVVGEQTDPADMGFAADAMRMPLEALGFEVDVVEPFMGFFERGVVNVEEGLIESVEESGRQAASAWAAAAHQS